MQTEDTSLRPNPFWKVVFVGGPLFLVLSSVGAMWLWWNESKETAPDPRLALAASEVREDELRDHLYKMEDLSGTRGWETPTGRRGIRRVVAFLEGTLSPQNYGFSVERAAYLSKAGELWPTVWVDLTGTERPGEIVMVAVPYDLAAGPIAVVLGAVNDLRDEPVSQTVRFLFYPAGLYDTGEGAELQAVLEDGEAIVEVVRPEQPEPERRQLAAELVPLAQDLVEKVREFAR